MRYLTVEQNGAHNDYTTALGERLAAHDKDDFDVIYYVCTDISTNIPGAKEKSLGYAHRLIELDPDRGTGYVCMADGYYWHWGLYGRHSEDAKQALHWYEEYLKHEKREEAVYKRNIDYTKRAIAKLQKWLAEQK